MNLEVVNRFITEEEASDFIKQSFVVVLPYIFASQSGVIPEVYSYGRPVIATNVGCLPEMVDDKITGYIVENEDYMSIGKIILDIYDNPVKLERLFEASLKKHYSTFTPSKMANELENVYKRLVCK